MPAIQQNDIKSLRATLFETIQALKREDKPMEIDRAKAICEASQTIINSVKVEIDFARVTGLVPESEFIPTLALPKPPAIQQIEKKESVPYPKPGTTHPAPGHSVHRIGS